MHDIEPHYNWRGLYVASEDEKSLFFGRVYSEFNFENKVYNYYIHPQWDDFGSNTLYVKLIYTDYEEGFAIMEFIGEWDDCLADDIMTLKRNLIDQMIEQGIYKYVLLGESVMNFHGGDDDYYAEWFEEVSENRGFISLLNAPENVLIEMRENGLDNYIYMGQEVNQFDWRKYQPKDLLRVVIDKLMNFEKKLT